MAYQLSAAKLQAYQRCAQAYYFRYERGIASPSFFGSPALGIALHKTLADIYQNWHYLDPLPSVNWIDECWSQHLDGLSGSQIAEGQEILRQYYHSFITPLPALHKPIGVEGKIQGTLSIENLEFTISGRYDRLDRLDDGLELIDYKSTKEIKVQDPNEVDLQMGLYYIALEQRYHQSLKRVSLIYLRTGEILSWDVTPKHQQLVEKTIHELALRLRTECEWEPSPGVQCDRCTYARYCPGICQHPEPLPADAKPERELQLVLRL